MLRRLIAMLTGVIATGGCSTSPQDRLPPNQPGAFAISEVQSKQTPGGTVKTWLATARDSGGSPFSFRLEMLVKTAKGNDPIGFTRGAIIREAGADGRAFLNDVARAIESEATIPTHTEKTERLEFPIATLGTQGDNWIATKIFLADGEAEVFLNINPADGLGEFSTKDPEYGESVIQELAKVFLP